MDRNAPIGVFDSGIGGLTVAREIMRQMPQERIVYFGDTARVPYGSKSQETVLRYSRQIIRFLKTQGVKAIVIACNTASRVHWRRSNRNWISRSSELSTRARARLPRQPIMERLA